MDEVPDPSISGNATKLLFAGIVVLGGVVSYLFRLMWKRETTKDKRLAEKDAAIADLGKDAAVDRATHETKLEKLRATYEEKYKELAQKYADDLRQVYEDNRTHEDTARKEFAEIMETVAVKAGESSQAIVKMLEKFYDRFVGPKARY